MMKKRVKLIFLIYVAVCLLFTGYYATRRTEQIRVDRYGLSKDDAIELAEDSLIACEFRLTEDSFQGVSVRFQTESVFQDEQLKAVLMDCETEAVIAEDTIQLKYERIQNKDGGSSIYFRLPVENVNDREVRLELTLVGDDVRVFPSFVISETNAQESVLFRDGQKIDGNLVFSTRYSLGATRNIAGTVLNGLQWLAVGTLIFYFYCGVGKGAPRKTKNKAGCQQVNHAVFSKLHGKMILGFLFMIGCCGVLLLYVYQYYVEGAVAEDYSVLRCTKFAYVFLGIMIFAAAALVYWICFISRKSIEHTFVILALAFGIIFNLVIGLGTVPDEPSHIDTAYAISNKMLGVPDSEKPGYIYKRIEDIDAAIEDKQSLDIYHYERLFHQLFTMAEDETLVECSVRSNLGNAGVIYYIPQALGLTLGRLAGFGYMPTMMLARIFGLFFYVMITYFAIRKLPIGKLSLLLIGILPISLQQAASFSYDGMINAIAFLYLGYWLYIIYGNSTVTTWDFAVAVVSGAMMATVKGGVYIPLCLLPLLALFTRKEYGKRMRRCVSLSVVLFMFAFGKGNLAGLFQRFSAAQGTVIGGASSSEVYTFGYLLRYPHRFIGMFVNTFYRQGDAYVRNLLGGNLAWREVNINWTVMFGVLLVILLSCIVSGQERRIRGCEKGYIGLLCFGSYACIELSMMLVWTPVTHSYITGVQGRYFIPFFLLVLLILRNSFFRIKKNIDNILIFAMGMLNIIIILQVIQFILK